MSQETGLRPRLLSCCSLSSLRRAIVWAVAALALLIGCDSPTEPDNVGNIALNLLCGSDASLLQCSAQRFCSSGLGPCPDLQVNRTDATRVAVWSSGDSSILRLVGPGTFQAMSTGNTVVHAKDGEMCLCEGRQTVTVFEGTGPLPTGDIFGGVREAGTTGPTGLINGAVVEVLNGHVAGRTAISGVPPPLLPGYLGPFGGTGSYRSLGVPPGSYTLRATASGYASKEGTVLHNGSGTATTEFQLLRP